MNGMTAMEIGYSDGFNSNLPNSNQAMFARQEYIDGYAQGSIDRDANNSPLYEVVVGNVGTVYSGTNGFEAFKTFQIYCGQSKSNYGRAAGEDVTLFKNGEIRKEFQDQSDVPMTDYLTLSSHMGLLILCGAVLLILAINLWLAAKR